MAERGDRNQALDFTKGILVLFMVLYHWFNYFVGTEGSVYTYLRFITPSFIFIAGFVIANVYPTKYQVNPSQAYQRLTTRGLKLLGIFTALNIGVNLVFTKSYSGAMPGLAGFIHNLGSVYVSGNAKASFEVLVPISYLLILSSVLLLMARVFRYSISLVCALLFLWVCVLDLRSMSSANLTLLAIGLLGMVLGSQPLARINDWASHSYTVIGLNIAYLIAISIWGVGYALQTVGVCVTLTLIYLVGMKSTEWDRMQRPVILLGKYSLLAYIGQIALLQVLQRGLPHLNLGGGALSVTSFIAAFALTFAAVELFHLVRAKSTAVDVLYKFAFS